MSQPPALLDALRGVSKLLAREGLRWYVFGAQAVVVYGRPRLTADLDVTIEATLGSSRWLDDRPLLVANELAMQTQADPGRLARELEAYRDVTRAFPRFLGLRMVPLGAWFLLVPALGPFDARPAFVVPLLAAVAASWGIGRWYRRRFGSVETGQASLGRNWPLSSRAGSPR